jgi:hypothetical protein
MRNAGKEERNVRGISELRKKRIRDVTPARRLADFPAGYFPLTRVLCAETHRQLPSRSTQTSV